MDPRQDQELPALLEPDRGNSITFPLHTARVDRRNAEERWVQPHEVRAMFAAFLLDLHVPDIRLRALLWWLQIVYCSPKS
jgi:hypothetical protein